MDRVIWIGKTLAVLMILVNSQARTAFFWQSRIRTTTLNAEAASATGLRFTGSRSSPLPRVVSSPYVTTQVG